MSWTASKSAGWLALTPVSGTNSGTVTVAVATSGLAAGTYTDSITVSAPGITPRSIPVSLVLTTGPILSVTPTSLSFSAVDRGYHDFGVSLQEWRAGVKSKGAA